MRTPSFALGAAVALSLPLVAYANERTAIVNAEQPVSTPQGVPETLTAKQFLRAGNEIAFLDRPWLEENPEDFMQIHNIEITFHKAASMKDLDLMMSLFATDAVLSAGGKTYTGTAEIRDFWKSAGTFQPQNQWVAYTPAFRIRYNVEGDRALLYFECLYVDKAANKITAHTNSFDTLVKVHGHWLINEMKAAAVPQL